MWWEKKTTDLVSIQMETFESAKKVVEYLTEAKALPWLMQNEWQLVMTMRSFAEMWVTPAQWLTALWSAHKKKWDLPDTVQVIQRWVSIGLDPQEAVAGMYPVRGTVTAFGATAMKLLIMWWYRLKTIEKTATNCDVQLIKWDEIIAESIKFSQDDAKRAGLWDSTHTWKKYPQDMLFWKCVARAINQHCPEVLWWTALYEDVVEALQWDVVEPDQMFDDMHDWFEDDWEDPNANWKQEMPEWAVKIWEPIPARKLESDLFADPSFVVSEEWGVFVAHIKKAGRYIVDGRAMEWEEWDDISFTQAIQSTETLEYSKVL